MLKGFLSRYRFRYLSTLVYMLQSSEYSGREYLRWLHRTHNFDLVARRGQLDRTRKAQLLLAILVIAAVPIWSLIILFLIGGLTSGVVLWLVLAIVIAFMLPYWLAYGLLVPLWLGQLLVQKPRERAIVRSARRKLAALPAIKIGIAGSYGKTTMKDLLATVLQEGKAVAATPGNLNTPLGISSFVGNLEGDEEVLIFEMGEYYPGDIRDLCRLIEPDMGVITGINEAHLSKFRSLERTVRTIFELADYLRDDVETGEGPLHGGTELYVNGESELAHRQIEQRGAEKVMKQDLIAEYTRHGVGELKASSLSTDLEGTSFTLTTGEQKIHVTSGLLGLHQVGPLATVAAIGLELGLSVEQIETGLALTKPFEHRLEPKLENDIWTIDDTYNGNPDGAKAAIDFLGSLKGHKRYYVTPGLVEMGHRTREVHEQIGTWLAEAGIEHVILIETSAMEHIKHGLKAGDFKGKLTTYPDEITALMALPSLTTAGDVVLLQNDWGDQYA
jgi:UDP-N-acetylmuramoyl-tripeptide--D-alanyl-D-alanine ligase